MKQNRKHRHKRISYSVCVFLLVLTCAIATGCGKQDVSTETDMELKTQEQLNGEESAQNTGLEEIVSDENADEEADGNVGENSETDASEPFVPENPDFEQLAEDEYLLELENRQSVFGQGVGDTNADGSVTFSGGAINKCMIPMSCTVNSGATVTVTLKGSFGSKADTAVRVYLTNQNFENCTQELYVCSYTEEQNFSVSFELTATAQATGIMLASSGYDTFFQSFTLSSIVIGGDVEITEQSATGATEDLAGQAWYQEMLEKAQLSLGNNYRLKDVIERAQNGEQITVAAIGGSITEGAGAVKYKECYAYRTYELFKEAYGAGDGSNVAFVNAGVGGTPSTFGIMRYERDIVERTQDADGLPDIVMVEYAVNDGGEPTNHGCYESLVKHILQQENHPVVILVFSVFPSGYTLQDELKKVGNTYDLMMVSTRDGAFSYVGSKWTSQEFFYDVYHPTSLGHGVMADSIFHTIEAAAAQTKAAKDIDLNVTPAYSTDYVGLKTIFRNSYEEEIQLNLGSFTGNDAGAYQNIPIGKVYADNFQHISGSEALTFTVNCKNLLLAYRSVSDSSYGSIEVYVDGVKKTTISGNTGSWGQSVTELIFAEKTAKEHVVEIKMAQGDENKKFTITCMGYTE